MTTVLIADIGGTNVRFALADESGVHDPLPLKVADYDGPVAAARAYLARSGAKPAAGVFAVAGPVTGDVFTLTNFPWAFSVSATSASLGLKGLTLINDFHAQALGVLDVAPANLTQLGQGDRKPKGNMGIIGPGTGLGVASLVYDDKAARYVVVPGEGGHVTIPTLHAREFALIRWLLDNKYSHVSAERVCSGKGLVNLYDAIRGLDALDLPERDPEAISASAIAKTCPACVEAMDLMLIFLGRIAGNLALTNTTMGGVFFTGGILPRLPRDYVTASGLRPEFIAKGRQSGYVDTIPTFLVDDPALALRGLRTYALGATGA